VRTSDRWRRWFAFATGSLVPPPTSQPDGTHYEDVRQKLVERGYLDGRIEQFILGDILAERPGTWDLARTGLRAAALGAPILGGVLAGAAVAVNRPLLRAADAVVLWIYFSALAGAALFLLSLAAALAAGALARRRGARAADSIRASLLVALPTLTYLVVTWWQRRPIPDLAADALFLAAVLVCTLVVARLAGVVSLAGIIGRTGQVPDRSRRRILILVAVLVPLSAAALLVRNASQRGSAVAVAASSFEPDVSGDRLLFVGVDGLDSALVQDLEPHGAVAGLLDRMASGAVFPVRRAGEREPAEVWTTLMTGMPAEAHGVREAGGERLWGVAAPLRRDAGPAALEVAVRFLLPARTVPTTSAVRRVPTLWEIARLKIPSAAIGWWTSWPAANGGEGGGRGYVVSDRVLPKLLSGRAEDRDTAPVSLYARLAARFPAERSRIRGEFAARFAPLPRDLADAAWESFLIDAFQWSTAQLLMQDPGVRAAFVYLPGLDILRLRLQDPRHGIHDVSLSLGSYVSWLDGILSEALERRDGWCVLLVADRGRAARVDAEGFAVVVRGPAQPKCVGGILTEMDVTPLALSILGFPPSAEMAGAVPSECLDLPSIAEIPTYGRTGVPSDPAPSDFDPEMVERLRSLGYVR